MITTITTITISKMTTMKKLRMSRGAWVFTMCAAWVSASPAADLPLGCLIEPDHVADVGSQIIGVIEKLRVERGQRVKKGDVVATLRADVERAAVSAAKTRSEAVADIAAANANAVFARQRVARAKDLLVQKFISDQAYDQIRTEADVAEQKLAQAREQQRLAKDELGQARSQLEMRTVRSPLTGIVVERYMNNGERIDDKPMIRVAVVDPLRVQVVLPSTLYGRVRMDAAVTVTPELANASPVTARVMLIDKVLDAASNTFRVTLRLPNPGHALPAGLRCRADFGLSTPAASGRPTAASP